MSKNISDAQVNDFVQRVHHLYQGEHLLKGVARTRDNVVGVDTRFPVMGRGTATLRTASQVKLQLMNVAHSRVTCTLAGYNASEMTDIWDQTLINYDEKNELAQVIAGGLGRRKDQIIIDALVAASLSKSVAATSVGDEVGLNIERILSGHKKLNLDEVPLGDRHYLCHATDVEQALSLTEFGSADFNSFRLLHTASVRQDQQAFGLTWHIIGDRGEGGLPVTAGGVRKTYMWHKDALGVASASLIEGDISWLGDYGAWITSGFMKMGACLIDPTGAVEILCDEIA